MKAMVRVLAVIVLFATVGRCAAGADGHVGRFNVVAFGDRAIRVDTLTGETWLLAGDRSGTSRTGYVWESIPAPSKPQTPAKVRAEAPGAPPKLTAVASPDTSSDRLKLESEAPARLSVGESGVFAVRFNPRSSIKVSALAIELPSSLKPEQAIAGYERMGNSFTWRGDGVTSGRGTYAVQATAVEARKAVSVQWSVTTQDGKVLRLQDKLSILPKPVSDEDDE